jgi:RNA polymerase sigma factor (sigma-70 family)
MAETEKLFDAYLAAAAQSGDQKSFAALYARWNKRLIAHAWRLTGHHDAAREAAQDAWADIVRGLRSLHDTAAFPAWAYRIVSRRCASRVRAMQADRQLAAEIAATDASVETTDDADRLARAIATLPPDQRAAIALFYFDELSVAETAVALDVPVGTVKTRLLHARRKLRHILEGEDNA